MQDHISRTNPFQPFFMRKPTFSSHPFLPLNSCPSVEATCPTPPERHKGSLHESHETSLQPLLLSPPRVVIFFMVGFSRKKTLDFGFGRSFFCQTKTYLQKLFRDYLYNIQSWKWKGWKRSRIQPVRIRRSQPQKPSATQLFKKSPSLWAPWHLFCLFQVIHLQPGTWSLPVPFLYWSFVKLHRSLGEISRVDPWSFHGNSPYFQVKLRNTPNFETWGTGKYPKSDFSKKPIINLYLIASLI